MTDMTDTSCEHMDSNDEFFEGVFNVVMISKNLNDIYPCAKRNVFTHERWWNNKINVDTLLTLNWLKNNHEHSSTM